MSDVSRREVMKLTAAAVAGAVLAPAGAGGQDKPAKPPADPQLESALKSPFGFMFGEEITFKTSTTEPHTFDLIITSGYTTVGPYNDGVHVRPGTMHIFRAKADLDEFTKKGGMYWKCGATEGKAQFKQAGALVLIVRELDGTVRCYTLHKDFRC
jgi:hypothetical protein